MAEHLDAHRKRQQATHPDLTLTGMYNVLEKLRSSEALTAKERTIHEHGLVSVLRQLHDELDAAVLDAYGWSGLLPLLRVAHGNDAPHPLPALPALSGLSVGAAPAATVIATKPNTASDGGGAVAAAPLLHGAAAVSREEAKRTFDEAILERLVALNAERAAEEARGLVRWLRPEFQNPAANKAPEQARIDTGSADEAGETLAMPTAAAKPAPWPKDTVEQVRAVADLLSASPAPLSLEDIGNRFSARGPWKKRLPQLLDMLVALGRAQEQGGRWSVLH